MTLEEKVAQLRTEWKIERIADSGKRLEADAALRAFNAGVDMDLPDGVCYSELGNLVKAGKILTAELDASVRRVLCLKFRLGLFENPYADAEKASSLAKVDTTHTHTPNNSLYYLLMHLE